MGSLSNDHELVLLDQLTGKSPATYRYIRLTTTAPTDSTPGTEVSGGSYVPFQASTSHWFAASGGFTANSATLGYPTAAAALGDIRDWEVWSASAGGARLLWGALDAAKTVASGDGYLVLPTGIRITAD